MKKERTQITQELCDHVKILLAGGANIDKAAEITKTGHATISRIKAAGFDAEVYRKNQQDRKAKKKPEVVLTIKHEELAGQMEMDLHTAEEPKEISDQIKLMRFQAAQADKICEKITKQAIIINETMMTKLDRIYDMLGQILRAVRKE